MTNLINFIEKHSKNNSKKIAIITKDGALTYEELSKQSLLFRNSLNEISKNSVISLMFDNSIDFVISYIGTMKAGLVSHILSPDISYDNLRFQINSSGSKLLVVTNNKFDELQNKKLSIEVKKFDEMISENEHPIEISENFAHLLFTSGTTSKPKGVAITHLNQIFTLQNITSVLNYDSSDISLSPLPLNHSFGLGCLNATLYSGGQMILLNNASNLDEILDAIKKFKVTILAAVPATLIKLLKFHKKQIENEFQYLRLIITNSTSIPSQTVLEYKNILKNAYLATYYGLTEASRSTFMIFEKQLDKDTSVGKPAPGVEIKIENKNHNVGEIWIKGPNVIEQYWNDLNSEQTIENGWLKTGDLGYFDEEGFLYLSGRLDDVINVGGEKVFPEYVEKIIKKLDDVDEAVVVGEKHALFGQTVKAFVKLNAQSTLKKSDILSFCLNNLEKHMVPVKIELVDEFPLTDYGKIKRFLLQSSELSNDR